MQTILFYGYELTEKEMDRLNQNSPNFFIENPALSHVGIDKRHFVGLRFDMSQELPTSFSPENITKGMSLFITPILKAFADTKPIVMQLKYYIIHV